MALAELSRAYLVTRFPGVKEREREVQGKSAVEKIKEREGGVEGAKDRAEASMDELAEESHVQREINTIKETCINADQPESVVFEALQRLQNMQITSEVLKGTRVRKKVKKLRKHPSGRVCSLVKQLVRQWKQKMKESHFAAKMTTPMTTITTARCTESAFPPWYENVPLRAQYSQVVVTKLFGFLDDYDCKLSPFVCVNAMHGNVVVTIDISDGQVNESVSDHSYLHRGSLMNNSNDLDTESTTGLLGGRTMEKRGSVGSDKIEVHERRLASQGKRKNGIASQGKGKNGSIATVTSEMSETNQKLKIPKRELS